MRRGAVLLIAAALAAGCGEDDRDAVLETMEEARAALAAERPEEFCALVTEHGRRRSTAYIGGYENGSDCAGTVRRMIEDTKHPLADPSWPEALPRAKFEVEEVDLDRAVVIVSVDGAEATVDLRREGGRWLLHDTSDVPEGR